MYASALVVALAGLASAQSFTNSTTSSTATPTVCSGGVAQSSGAGPVPSPDTPAAFLAYAPFAATASAAAAPAGYSRSFVNLQGAVSNANYLGYYTLSSYSAAECAAHCSSTTGCTGFNTYYERDPIVVPGTGSGCTNPASTTNIKCALFGTNVTAAAATNVGQYRSQFRVVIAGSNGYNLIPHSVACPAGTTGGTCGNFVLNNYYEICACGLDTSGNSVEVQAIYCDQTPQTCASNNDCPANYVCQVSNCCSSTPICVPSVVCANNLSMSRIFRRGGATGKNSSLFKEGAPFFSS